ncbi:hypothetical protein DVH05_005041 [Phytophthora capsici]|nr:hypothetical protein DVH05_021695 [Phytophthora capsici]KAG1705016.1 hypothetical protein DVH05_005041 [Phytophthora capsici]
MSAARFVVHSFVSSVTVIVIAMAISVHLMFPVPFFLLVMFPVLGVVLVISSRIVIGSRLIRQILAREGQLTRYLHFVNAKCLLIFVYPAYEALFHAAHGTHYQIFAILLLPVLKIILKNIMWRRTTHMEDLTPETVIFTVDLFNSIYMATCMQSASSLMTVTVITVIDLTLASIMLYGLHHRTVTAATSVHSAVKESGNFLNGLCLLCRDLGKFGQQNRQGIHVYSYLQYKLDEADENLLVLLDKIPIESESTSVVSPKVADIQPSSFSDITKLQAYWLNRTGAVYPFTAKEEVRPVERLTPTSNSKKSLLLRESLETLFTMECLVIASYLEAVIPLFYAVYVLVVIHLRTAPYHTELRGITRENVGTTVLPVFVFGFLQIASIVLLTLLVKRNCGMKAMYQLAFVLETQMAPIQGKLMFWMLLTLCFRLVHFGVDFTFQFAPPV